MRKIFGPKRNDGGEYEMSKNEDLDGSYKEPTVTGSPKRTRVSWAGHVRESEGKIGSIAERKLDTKMKNK